MPTFSAISFENLLEPRVRVSPKKPLDLNEVAEPPAATPTPRHIYISPALYTTPETAPIPDHLLEPPSPSPYVVNFKRRGGGGGGGGGNRRSDGFELVDDENRKEESGRDAVEEVTEEENFEDGNLVEDAENRVVDEDAGEFLESKCESASVGSTNEMRQFDCRSFLSSQGEFFDAIEDFSADNSAPSTPAYGRGVETELQAARLSLLDEIERRKKAEEALDLMKYHWQGLTNHFAEAGLLFPVTSDDGEVISYEEFVKGLCRQFVVERSVAEAVGKVLGQVEAEATSELILESKDQEISRLSNRLKYYEAMTHEMSQRNLETVGVAREERQRKKSRRRLIWSCIGLSVVVGISVLGYPYLHDISKHIGYSHTSDGSPEISPSEAV